MNLFDPRLFDPRLFDTGATATTDPEEWTGTVMVRRAQALTDVAVQRTRTVGAVAARTHPITVTVER